MKIAVVGSGAMGSLFGGYLALAGHEVWFIDVREANVTTIEARGLVLKHADEAITVAGRGTTVPAGIGEVELAMFWCKSQSTRAAIDFAKPVIGSNSTVCTLQNGLGNVEALAEVIPIDQIVYGTTMMGADLASPGVVEVEELSWTHHAMTFLGARTPSGLRRAHDLASALNAASMPATISDNIDAVLWEKLAMATSLSPLTALTRLQIGHLLDDDDAQALILGITAEVVQVANAKGSMLDLETTVARISEAQVRTRSRISSMLQDVLEGRQLEIDNFCGAVVQAGKELGVKTPVNEVVWRLLRVVQGHYADQLPPQISASVSTAIPS